MSVHLHQEDPHALVAGPVGPAAPTTTMTLTTREPAPQLPTDTKGYYACRECRRILVESQWYREGCFECGTGPVHRGELAAYATPHFSNFVGLIDPQRSWVARLIGKSGQRGGVPVPNAIYAEAISEDEQDDVEDDEDTGKDDDVGGAETVQGEDAGAQRPSGLAGTADDTDLFGW